MWNYEYKVRFKAMQGLCQGTFQCKFDQVGGEATPGASC